MGMMHGRDPYSECPEKRVVGYTRAQDNSAHVLLFGQVFCVGPFVFSWTSIVVY